MKKIIFIMIAVAIASCSPEETVNTEVQDLSFSRMPLFVGEYAVNETYVNGELADTCNKTWNFTSTTVTIAENLDCESGTQSTFTTAYDFDDTKLYLANFTNAGIFQTEYLYVEDADGNLVVTLLTGAYLVEYRLTR